MSTLTLLVPGMTCRHCVRKVTAALRDVPGVQLVQADLTTSTVVLHGEPTVADVVAALDRAGFPGTVMPAPRRDPDTSDAADTARTPPPTPRPPIPQELQAPSRSSARRRRAGR